MPPVVIARVWIGQMGQTRPSARPQTRGRKCGPHSRSPRTMSMRSKSALVSSASHDRSRGPHGSRQRSVALIYPSSREVNARCLKPLLSRAHNTPRIRLPNGAQATLVFGRPNRRASARATAQSPVVLMQDSANAAIAGTRKRTLHLRRQSAEWSCGLRHIRPRITRLPRTPPRPAFDRLQRLCSDSSNSGIHDDPRSSVVDPGAKAAQQNRKPLITSASSESLDANSASSEFAGSHTSPLQDNGRVKLLEDIEALL